MPHSLYFPAQSATVRRVLIGLLFWGWIAYAMAALWLLNWHSVQQSSVSFCSSRWSKPQ